MNKNLTTSSVVDNIIRIRILVVDDDKICLAVTASVLKLFNYEVVTINCPLEALSSLRMNQDSFDIILSDVHMPLMSGLNFQRIVEFEFQIPVILMSADDQKDLLLKSLENGATFFIVKPPSINDLKNMWQYVISRKNAASNKSSICKEVEPYNETVNTNLNKNEVLPQTTYTNDHDLSCDYKTKPLIVQKVENITEEKSARSNSKKPKLIWTTALHNKFLEAISVIGPNRAVPKKILEYMNVPGLTRENIASHLQKYRIYVRRLSDSNGSMQHGMPLNWNERPFRSSFSWSQFPTLANNSLLLKYSNTTNHTPPQERTSTPNYGSQTNPFLHPNNPFAQQSANNIDTNYVHDNLDYNNLTQPMHILESSGLDPHNNNIYEDNGLINRVQPQTTSQQYQYFDGAFDNLTNTITQMSGFETHNNNVENNFMRHPVVNISSNFHNNEQFHVTNLNIISKDHQQVTIMSDLNAITTVQEEGEPKKSNISTRQIVVRNNDNVTNQNREDATTTFNFTGTTSAPMQDWAPNQLADFSMDNYGVEDFSTIFSNIDGPKENNNN